MEKVDKQKQATAENNKQDTTAPEEQDGASMPDRQQDQTEDADNLMQQVQILQDKLLRCMAETENVRARLNKNVEEAREYSIINFARDLIPVVDNFKRALQHVPGNLEPDMNNIVQGIIMTKDELERTFIKHGLESIEPQEGDDFNYNYHHAIAEVMTDKYKTGTIVGTMQVGYRIKDRLIRPASVTVAKMPPQK